MYFYRKIRPIHAITFDLDDTLYENTSVIVNAEKALIELMHRRYPVTELIDQRFWRRHQASQLNSNPQLKNDMSVLRELSLRSGFSELGLTGSTLNAATEDCFTFFYDRRSDFKINKNVHSLLERLAGRLPLVALTNGNVNLEKIDLNRYFSACFKANLNMPMKPHRAMFNAAKKHLDLAPENILHVGDNLHKDIYGAIRAGYQTAWYAHDRNMDIKTEKTLLLPHMQLTKLEQLLDVI